LDNVLTFALWKFINYIHKDASFQLVVLMFLFAVWLQFV